MKVINVVKKQSKKRPLKRAKTGFEVEMHIIDDTGAITNKGFWLVNEVKRKYPKVDVVKECGLNMLELGCYPDVNVYDPALQMVRFVEKVVKTAKESGLRAYPFGTYPGAFKARFTKDPSGKYMIQRKIFGKERFGLAPKVAGFHHHYALPKGVFDEETKNLKLMIDSKLKRSMMNCYNFEIAIDPILTLLTQSSPFYDGKQLAKNSRMLVYRGGKKLGYPGLYENHQQLGGLPPYKQTETDLLISIQKRMLRWKKLVKKAQPDAKFKELYPYVLDISWHPVKINKHGTLEQRGMDMNYISIMLGVSALIKFCLRKIQRDFIEVIPADLGITESFKIKKGIMFVPPHTYVRNTLQKASAYEGFCNAALYDYTKRFYNLARSLTPEFYYPLIDKVKEMIDKRCSTSDQMVAYAKRNNLMNQYGYVSKENAKQIALHFSKKFEKDLKETKATLKKIAARHEKITGK
jgi:carboxylate-amine ligase